MTAIVSCLAGVLGMLALWCWAWRLWQRSACSPPEDQLPRMVWHGELLPPRRRPTPPPSWLFEDSLDDSCDAAAVARIHASSNTDTSLFAREQGSCEERTEVLSEQQILDPGQTQPGIGGKTCKIGPFARSRANER
jgi:hypothetical protein